MGQAKQRREQAQQRGASVVPLIRKGPKRITADEGAYLRRVIAGAEQAAQLEQQAVQLEQQAVALRQQAVAKQGAYESWVESLCEKYGLSRELDDIDCGTLEIKRGRATGPVPVPDAPPAPPTTSLKPKRESQGKVRPGGEGDETAATTEA